MYTLNVTVKPLDVHILTKESRVLADKKYEVECRSSGSRPAAVITWWIANRRIDNQTKTVSTQSIYILLNENHVLAFGYNLDKIMNG